MFACFRWIHHICVSSEVCFETRMSSTIFQKNAIIILWTFDRCIHPIPRTLPTYLVCKTNFVWKFHDVWLENHVLCWKVHILMLRKYVELYQINWEGSWMKCYNAERGKQLIHTIVIRGSPLSRLYNLLQNYDSIGMTKMQNLIR